MRIAARRLLAVAWLTATFGGAAMFVACGLDVVGAGPTEDASVDRGPPPEASVPPPAEAGPDADAAVEAGPLCPPELPGPTMVEIPDAGFCIDSTEVTNAQYDEFLAATDGGDPVALADAGIAAACQSKARFNRAFGATGPADHPTMYVDWCDAVAYCAWAGKQLCSRETEWHHVCTRGGTRQWPYGTSADAGECHVVQPSTAEAGSSLGCEGGYAGVFDMVGNASEWVDDCTGDDCAAVGGDYTTAGASCDTAFVLPRNLQAAGYGFRCCRRR
jgi:formylglycine-generating enzyme